MRPGVSSSFFHTTCVDVWSVSTSVLLFLLLVTTEISVSGILGLSLVRPREATRLLWQKVGREEEW